ncbi:MAG TPA: transglycosylase SLT domain-containing protein [Xanthobacteraceae bacterium]|nr:transglycosylase SLT domain-containing protein [Xanthobacteraceae bacterium]
MLLEATGQIVSGITGAIRNAARATGASFEYLLKTAQRESNFNASAKASTSSASGLFQFIDQTWLQTLKSAGPELGYGRYAAAIVQTETGRYVVPDPAQRGEIMRLRTDPAAASAMAGAFTQRNAALLTERLGRAPTDGELYIAHFLGPTGAVQLITTAATRPEARAADLFPRAARANRAIFYANGSPRSAAQVYDVLVAKHDNTRVPPVIVATSAALAAQAENLAPVQAYAPAEGPVFHGLFRTERKTPVAAIVSQLWTAGNVPPATRKDSVGPAAAGTAAAGRSTHPLELFEFLRPETRPRIRRST